MSKHHLKSATGALLPLLFLLLAFSISPWFTRFEQELGLPWLFQCRGSRVAPEAVIIITMDANSARKMNLPAKTDRWPRTLHARLIRELKRRGAAVIVFDIAFKNPRDPQQDQDLAEAVREAGNVVLFKYLHRSQVFPISDTGRGTFVDIEREIPPAGEIGRHAAAIASFTLPKFPLRVHRAKIFTDLSGGIEPTLPLAALQVYLQPSLTRLHFLLRQSVSALAPTKQENVKQSVLSQAPPEDKPDILSLTREIHRHLEREPALRHHLAQLIKKHFPPGERQNLLTLLYALQQTAPVYINYYGPAATLTTVSYDSLLAGSPLPDMRGKAVFIGLAEQQQTEQRDAYNTVFTRNNGVDISGVEIGATLFANLLQRNLIQPLPAPLSCLLLLLWCLLLYVLLAFFDVKTALAIQLLLTIGYVAGARQLFNSFNLWLPLATPLVLLLFSDLAAISSRYRYSRYLQTRITDALGHYLPKEAAAQLSRDIGDFQSRHQVVKGLCFMTDLQGYTAIAEKLPPDQLHRAMNEYYENLLSQVIANGGRAANIVGDGLLAMWTGQTISPQIVRQACLAALAVQKSLDHFQLDGSNLPTSIAIHGGCFSLGNLGAINHYEYSPVGDIVNTTARLESLNRQLGTKILLTKTVAQNSTGFIIRYLGRFNVKNKQEAIVAYELVGVEADINSQSQKRLAAFADALSFYEHVNASAYPDDLKRAGKMFTSVLKEFPDDGPSLYYRNICNTPP